MTKKNDKKKSRQMNMLEGSLYNKILLFALPLAASSILQQLFNSADVAVVGRFAGSRALAAVGSNSSVINLLVNLFVGLSVGANVVVARYIGQKEKDRIQDAIHSAMTVAFVSGIFLLFLGIFMAKYLLLMMNTPDDVIDLAVLYLRIYFLGMPFFMVYNFGAAILRSTGDTKRPLYCLMFSGILNLCLNLILVILFDLGVAGVGIATVVANSVSAALILKFLLGEEEPIKLHIKQLKIKKQDLMDISKIGIPAGVQGMVFSLSNVCIQAAINSFGSDAVAGSAAAANFEYFNYFIINAFSQAAVTFVSQNYGAGKYDRCKKIFHWSMFFAMTFSTLFCIAMVRKSSLFIQFYTTEPVVVKYAVIRIAHIMTFAFLTATYEVTGSVLRGMGYSMLPALITVAGVCGFRLVWIYTVFRKFSTFEMLMDVYPITWIITGVAMLAAYFIVSRKHLRKKQDKN